MLPKHIKFLEDKGVSGSRPLGVLVACAVSHGARVGQSFVGSVLQIFPLLVTTVLASVMSGCMGKSDAVSTTTTPKDGIDALILGNGIALGVEMVKVILVMYPLLKEGYAQLQYPAAPTDGPNGTRVHA